MAVKALHGMEELRRLVSRAPKAVCSSLQELNSWLTSSSNTGSECNVLQTLEHEARPC